MGKKTNKNKSAEAPEGAVQSEGKVEAKDALTPPDEIIDGMGTNPKIEEEIPSDNPPMQEDENANEGLEKRKEELSDWTAELEARSANLNTLSEKLDKQETELKEWSDELRGKAEKLKTANKPVKEDKTYAKKLSNCFLHGTVEEYIRTSAEQFEGGVRHDFLNAVISGAEAVKENT